MEVKVGIDIIEVSRIKDGIDQLGDAFLKKIFTSKEIEYCKNSTTIKYQSFAARFAAKEATFKAISTLLKDKFSISWTNIQVTSECNGKPCIEFVSLTEPVKEELDKIQSMDVSLSHLKDYAVANVTLLIK